MRAADRAVRPGQEACAHAVGDVAEAQVEARRLDLVGREIARRNDGAVCGKLRDHAVGQYPLLAHREGRDGNMFVSFGGGGHAFAS